jgi:NAD-dependent dihydropyrimidine dehydrogenase PreA subunit
LSHHLIKTGYNGLVERLNRFSQGATPSESLFKILKVLFSERDAAMVSQLPVRPFSVKRAARIWKLSEVETRKILEDLAERAILLDVEKDGVQTYILPPPMIGFFEFSLMRLRGDIDQKALSELLNQYVHVEDDFLKALFMTGETQVGRIFVHEPAIPEPDAVSLCILDYERATEVIKTAAHRGISLCYCRHKMAHLGRDCDAPKEICMTFNDPAQALIKHHHARSVSKEECLDLLQAAWDHKLVQFGSNVREGIGFICNCCGCCCEAMASARRFGLMHPIHTTNYLPTLEPDAQNEKCKGCGRCVSVCPVAAMSLVTANDPRKPKRKKAYLNEEICLGCGLCVRECPDGAIALKERPQRVIPPLNAVHQAVVMAIERGKLQNLIFDNHALMSHRFMAAILGTILKLPPVKQLMASEQVKSRYLEALLRQAGMSAG